MTICIGILASDGIVIAADREEGDGYVKTDQGKISTATRLIFPVGSIAVTGSGWGSYLDEVAERLRDKFCDIAESTEKAVFPNWRKFILPTIRKRFCRLLTIHLVRGRITPC